MPLNTRIYILDQIRPKDVFAKCVQIQGGDEGLPVIDEYHELRRADIYPADSLPRWTRVPWGKHLERYPEMRAVPFVYYRHDAPIRETTGSHDWICDPDCDEYHPEPACWVEINLDTAYGSRDEQGRWPGDIHACLVVEIGQWLDAQQRRWLWMNEFTWEVHEGYSELAGLCTPGFRDAGWFQGSALQRVL